MGVISAIGHNVAEFWSSLCSGRVGIAALQSVDRSLLRFQNGAEVHDYEPGRHFKPGQADLLDRFAQFALIAAREAIRDSSIELTPELRENTAVITGSCIGGQGTQDVGFVDLYLRNRGRVHPLTIARTMANAGASHISMELGTTGPAFTISTACSSSNHALGLALRMIRSGEAELALAGGSEAPFSPGLLKAWEAMRVIAPDT
jgi:nodulation protein E